LIVGFDVVTNGLANLKRADNPGAIENLNFYGRYGENYGFGSGFRGVSEWQPRWAPGYGGSRPDVAWPVGYSNRGYGFENGLSTLSPWDAGATHLPASRARYGVDPYTANIIQNRDLELRRQAQRLNGYVY
jgi:hypothetical protein